MKKSLTIWLSVLALIVIVFYWGLPEQVPQQSPTSNTVPMSGDRDSAAEEVRAAATEMIEIREKLEEQNRSQREINLQIQEESANLFNSLSAEIQELNSTRSNATSVDTLNTINERLSILEANLEARQISLDYEIESTARNENSLLVWIEPLVILDPNAGEVSDELIQLEFDEKDKLIEQVYTLPAATIVDAIAVTALIGRIPVDGHLDTPWRFKLVSRASNLTSRGQEVPGLAGVLWSGFAYGDFTLSCVSGVVDTVTYVFDDLTISTQRLEPDPDNLTAGMGWISDSFGNPCVPGELKTNAPEVIRRSITSGFAEGLARGYSDAQTQRTVDDSGTTTVVTGDVANYAITNAVADAVTESNRWLQQRLNKSFDAIYVPAGRKVVIHIERQVEFDRDLGGRRLAHNVDQSFSEPQYDSLGGYD